MNNIIKQLENAFVQWDEAWSQLTRQVSAGLKERSLTVPPAQGSLLRILDYLGPQRMSDIAAILDISLGGCTAVVDRATDAGLVERYRDEADRRVVWVQLTEKGNETLGEIRRLRAQIFVKYLDQLEPAEIRQIADLLSRTASAVQAGARSLQASEEAQTPG